ncbi:MAG: hypothetical protein MUO19_01670, partial [Dehalococcoidales bacterium]|nr:hypothetical protein [Dehalococcoidales bacterium]
THGDMESAGLNTPGTRRLYGGLFPSGFGRFAIAEYTSIDDANPEAYPFTLIIGSSRFHFGNGTRSSRSARLSRKGGGVQVEINPRDADVLDMKQGDEVNVTSPAGTVTADIKVTPAVPPGILFMPASHATNGMYKLFDTVLDDQSKAPALKSCAVRLERAAADG